MGRSATKISIYTYIYIYITALSVISEHTASIVKLKVKVTIEQATKAQRGSRGIALLFL